jgi:hypothetical protein
MSHQAWYNIFMLRMSEDTVVFICRLSSHFPEDTMLLYIPLPVHYHLMTPHKKPETL